METPLHKDCNFNSQKEILKFLNLKKWNMYVREADAPRVRALRLRANVFNKFV